VENLLMFQDFPGFMIHYHTGRDCCLHLLGRSSPIRETLVTLIGPGRWRQQCDNSYLWPQFLQITPTLIYCYMLQPKRYALI